MLFLNIPKEINIELTTNFIEMRGPLGTLKKKKSKLVEMFFDENTRKLYFLNKNKETHFYLSILDKLLWGIWKGYSIKLTIIGIGYKAIIDNGNLTLKIGFSHLVKYAIPKDVRIKILSKKTPTFLILGSNLQKITQVASEIRLLKPADTYKGKGIRYFNEIVKLKKGKKANV
jgi:large subunit ribosomal protein L6